MDDGKSTLFFEVTISDLRNFNRRVMVEARSPREAKQIAAEQWPQHTILGVSSEVWLSNLVETGEI